MKRAGLGSRINGDNWIEVLDELLGSLEATFEKSSDYGGKVDFRFRQGCLYDASKNPAFHRPSYNLYITFRSYDLIVIHYETDLQWGLNVSQDEFNRICSLLAKKAVNVISVFGFCTIVEGRYNGSISTYDMKESAAR
jgi:hypothetical protein